MLTDAALQRLADKFAARVMAVSDKYVHMMAKHLRDIGNLTASDVHRLVEFERMGANIAGIKSELVKAVGRSIGDLEQVFRNLVGYNIPGTDRLQADTWEPYKISKAMDRLMRSYYQQTAEAMVNISQTTVSNTAYRKAVDSAIDAVSMGVQDYSGAIRGALKEAAVGGLRVRYAGGTERRADSAIRMNILDGTRQLNQRIAMQVGVEYGADGVELSAHALCAEDHLPYQGLQFSMAQFEKLQSTLERPIGQWNCKHFAFPILLGISEPAHSDEQLHQFRHNSNECITIDGRRKTRYEWSQEQRRIETAIRHQKDIANAAKAAGDDVLRRETQQNINNLSRLYDRVSNGAGLIAQRERMTVAGFRPVNPLTRTVPRGIIKVEPRSLPLPVPTPKFSGSTEDPIHPQSAYNHALTHRFDSGTRLAQEVYVKHIPDGGAIQDGAVLPEHSAWYDPNTQRVTMNFKYDESFPVGKGRIWYHEHGHYVDYTAGKISSNKLFEQMIRHDFQDVLTATAKANGLRPFQTRSIFDLLNREILDLPDNAQYVISDIFDGVSSHLVGPSWGHRTPGYWNSDSLTGEAFANMFYASFDKDALVHVKKYLPKSFKVFEELMSSLL